MGKAGDEHMEQTEPAFNGFLQLPTIAFSEVVNIHVINKAAHNLEKMIPEENVLGGLGCFLCSLDPLQPHPCQSLIQGLGRGGESSQGCQRDGPILLNQTQGRDVRHPLES